jgi:hypothetical protein
MSSSSRAGNAEDASRKWSEGRKKPSVAPISAGETDEGETSAATTYSSSYAKEAHEALKRSLQLGELSNQHGESALQSLGKQRETIHNSLQNVEETHDALRGSRRALRDMRFAQWKEAGVKALVIAGLLGIIALIVWVKWGKRK